MGLSTLESGGRWYAYSGIVSADATLPTSYDLIKIPNTGLRDSYVKIQPFYGVPVSAIAGEQLGLQISLNDISVYESQPVPEARPFELEIFVPRQSQLDVLSLNTAANNNQDRGVIVVGWYIG